MQWNKTIYAKGDKYKWRKKKKKARDIIYGETRNTGRNKRRRRGIVVVPLMKDGSITGVQWKSVTIALFLLVVFCIRFPLPKQQQQPQMTGNADGD